MAMDVIGDLLTAIRNASAAHKQTCEAPFSKLKKNILTILRAEGYIRGFSEEKNERGLPILEIGLKYVKGAPAISEIKRCSKPGRRLYYSYQNIPKTLGGLGTSILSTSKGVMKDRRARKERVGGEHICCVW
jgi:small subunit ribosomal protein S8